MTIINHLNVLETAGLVRVARVTPDLEYLFRHNLVQDAVYTSLLDDDQRRLHLAVGQVLESLYQDKLDEMATTLAYHYEKAGEEGRALKYHILAAETALATYANQEAESHFRSALDLQPVCYANASLLSGWGEALFRQSRFEEAIQTWRRGIQIYQMEDDDDGVARLYSRSARAAWFAGDIPGGLELCLEGMAAIDGASESPGIAHLIHETARAHYFNGNRTEALSLCKQALKMAEKFNDVEVLADSLTTLGILPNIPSQEALEALHRALELAESNGLLHIASRAHINLGSMKNNLFGDVHATLQHFMHAAEIARRRGIVSEEIFCRRAAASMLVDVGKIKEVEHILISMEEMLPTLSDPLLIKMELSGLRAVLLSLQGKFTESLEILRACQQFNRQRGDLQFSLSVCGALASITLEMDTIQPVEDWSEVETALQEAIAIGKRGFGRGNTWPTCLLSRVRSRQGRFSEARQLLEEARQTAGDSPSAWEIISFSQVTCELARAEKRWTDALEEYETNLARFRRQGLRWMEGHTLMLSAETYSARGEPGDLLRAQALMDEARAIFEQCDIDFYARLSEEKLQAIKALSDAQALAQKKVHLELAQAGRIQESFLPESPPNILGWQLAVAFKPARQTSGDYYDFIPLSGGRMGIVIADVTDKGIGAALYMASSRSLIRAFAAEYPDNPELALAAVNRRITADTHGGLFITVFYAILDPANGRLVYCNAGHNPPFLFGAQPEVPILPLVRTGVPVGIFAETSWNAETINMGLSETLLLYTDGITEAQDENETFFGEKQLLQAARDSLSRQTGQKRSAQEVLDAILRQALAFNDKVPQQDDITLIVLLRDE